MSDSSSNTTAGKDASADDAAKKLQTDETRGADKQWPDEAKIVPDAYLGDDAKK